MSPLYLKVSRPRFWPYLWGPFLIGLVAAGDPTFSWRLLLAGLFFTFPANLLIYGFNDIFDYETDKHNQKKKGYETLLAPSERSRLLKWLTAWGVLGILLVTDASVPIPAKWAMTGFYFFGLGYSVPPIRAKARRLLDSMFNILYVFPGLVSYGLTSGSYPPLHLLLAAGLWCMAMHAYSAVPDIAADRRAKIQTIATWLHARGTLWFCLACYVGATALSAPSLGVFGLLAGAVYIGLMLASLTNPTQKHVFSLYKWFPLINMIVGAGLFFWIALVVK